MHKFSDSYILETAKANKSKALEIAFGQYWELLYRHASRKLNSEELVKDIVQEVFIAMWDNLDQLSTQDQLLPYLYAVLRNRIISEYKRDTVRLRYAFNHSQKEEQLAQSGQQILLNKELQSIINEEINKMPARMREIYQLKKENNYSIREISEKLNLSEQTVKNQLFTASNRLKSRLTGYDPSLIKIGLLISGVCMISQR